MSGENDSRGGLAMRFVRRVGGRIKTSLAVVGFAAVAGLYLEYRNVTSSEKEDDKKKVLVVPFHRLQLVERKNQYFGSKISRIDVDKEDRLVEMEVRELVDLIHTAAMDPEIVALYGIFGHGSLLSQAGWADLEEVRNALRVFRESHRRHPEPNLSHQMQVIPRIESKPLYAYADTFASPMDPANKEYYLASQFTHIHLQNKGELNLFGLLSQHFFLRGLLEKYGIVVHVFKHGQYKNSPNMFTESRLNRAHRENVTNIMEGINSDVCEDITGARSKALLTSWLKKKKDSHSALWKRIHESGTFPALTAWKAGLVDYLPTRDPLSDLVDSNKSEIGREIFKKAWGHQETDFDRFKAEKAVSLESYANKLAKKKQAEERKEKWKRLIVKHPRIASVLSAMGVDTSEHEEYPGVLKKQESIALVHVTGGIGDSAARKLVHTIRKIRKDEDTKCVIVRVSSPGGSIFACETILQELKALKVPVIFSFGNVSASGGYYIASCADRIFASRKTLTGSIGVFGIRADLTGLADKYGVGVQQVAAGDLSAMYSPFHPMTRKMKQNIAGSIDRYYAQFKGVVAEGRRMTMEEVEEIAQGRVWIGEQAKTNGLVDELGGMHRAIAYAQRTYTSGEGKVVVWPKESFFEKLMEAREQGDAGKLVSAIQQWIAGTSTVDKDSLDLERYSAGDFVNKFLNTPSSYALPGTLAGVMLTSDENTAIRCLLDNVAESNQNFSSFPGFWE